MLREKKKKKERKWREDFKVSIYQAIFRASAIVYYGTSKLTRGEGGGSRLIILSFRPLLGCLRYGFLRTSLQWVLSKVRLCILLVSLILYEIFLHGVNIFGRRV